MSDAAVAVAEFGAEQWGLITSAQARMLGVTAVQMKRLADRGALERVHHGIYRMTRLPYDPRQDLRVAWVALDLHTPAWERLSQPFPGGVVSHRSAAHLHEVGDLDADLTELTCRRRIRLRLPDIRIHTGTVAVDDWTVVDGLPVTTARRTIADLAAEGIDGGHLAGIVRDALARELVSVPELESTLASSAFDYGHVLGDGRPFLDSLIAQAGVSQNTLGLADAYRRSTKASAAHFATDHRAGPRLPDRPSAALATRSVADLDRDDRVLPFAFAASTGRFDELLKRSNDARVADALGGLAVTQLAPLGEQLRALAAAAAGPPEMEAARTALLQSLQTPSTDMMTTSVAKAIEPVARRAAANMAARLRGEQQPPNQAAGTGDPTPDAQDGDTERTGRPRHE
ncbi:MULTISPECIES: type IV toxin-antitoxin system AbiEi family antitoxin domain-containing protein [Rhodococcus]|nr:type IV toxin-antitoxin system AbiEi family antitoxin domain-containing protein [Rhodococcus opacus]MDJ0420768.1 type IV toxin-antitoxin system AbiEi family antitoxin domain-containing protein [Rhodococcus opacus]MDV6248066.1 type IV toxin-antitoxin system AbiEi family antitoxin domain-containing protein [Rhodococcus opacus]MDV7090934.1 type IV toxin-antitoxin system AbiEi family antitoxin domain-containing protein [Rhodococcus opacus]UNN05103.1 type IV toxin-antitoxin system AbiEi family an